MGKKRKTIEEVREAFEKEGYQLLSTKYKNNKQKLEYICPIGHIGSICWNDWQQNHRCAECSGLKKKSIDFVRREFEKEGYQLLSTEYVNNRQKLKFRCSVGHIHSISFYSWKIGRRCAECAGNKIKNINFIRKEFEKEGYTLITTKYKGNKHNLEYVCPVGHQYTTTWNKWDKGNRCYLCSKTAKKTLSFIRQEFKNAGYCLLVDRYENAKQKLSYICPKGHKGGMSWCSFQQGYRCAECAGRIRKDINFIREEFKKEGYQLLTEEYKSSKQKLEYICPAAHKSSILWSDWSFGKRCSTCAHIRLSGSGSPRWKNYTIKELKQFKTYRLNVTQITNQNFRKYYYYINPNKLTRSYEQYHVDHILSVEQGFVLNILPEIISSPINLQMLSAKENMKKHNKSDMTKEVLYELYYQFEEEIKN